MTPFRSSAFPKNFARRLGLCAAFLLCGQWMAAPRAWSQVRGRFIVPDIRSEEGTRFSYWSQFQLPQGVTASYKIPHLPNDPGPGDEAGNFSNYNVHVNLQQTGSPTAFLTSSKAIYDFREEQPPLAFEINYTHVDSDEPVTNVIFQAQTAGTNLDRSQVRLYYKPEGSETEETVAPVYRALDRPVSGAFNDRMVSALQWDLTGLNVRDFSIRFRSSGQFMAFYQAQLDTVVGKPFKQQLGYVLDTRASPGLRYDVAGDIDRILPRDGESRFFVQGSRVELEAFPASGFEAVGWVDENGQVIDSPENLTVTFTDRDLLVKAIFSPVSWADYRYYYFNHGNDLFGTGNDYEESNPVSAPETDLDQDGLTNFEEYAFGGDPYVNDAASLRPVASVVTVDGERYPAITWSRQAAREETDLVWTVEESTDLRNWRSNGPGQTVTMESGSVLRDNGTRLVTARGVTPLSAGAPRFLRVRVEVMEE